MLRTKLVYIAKKQKNAIVLEFYAKVLLNVLGIVLIINVTFEETNFLSM